MSGNEALYLKEGEYPKANFNEKLDNKLKVNETIGDTKNGINIVNFDIKNLINDYFNGKVSKKNRIFAVKNILPFLNFDQFIELYNKESVNFQYKVRQSNIDFFELFLKTLDKFRSDLGRNIFKKKLGDINTEIEGIIQNLYGNNKKSYFEEKILNDKKYSSYYKILSGKNALGYTRMGGKYYLALYKDSVNLSQITSDFNLTIDLENYYNELEGDGSLALIELDKVNLKKTFYEDIDLLKFFRGENRGRKADEKFDSILDNINGELLILLYMHVRSHKGYSGNFNKLLDIKKSIGKVLGKGEISRDVFRGISWEIQGFNDDNLTKISFKGLLELSKVNILEFLDVIDKSYSTKKGKKKMEEFLKTLSETRGRGNRSQLNNLRIARDLMNNINKSKNSRKNIISFKNDLAEVVHDLEYYDVTKVIKNTIDGVTQLIDTRKKETY